MNGPNLERAIDPATAEGAAELELHLRSRLGGQVGAFRVVVADGGLILRGRAHTYYAKQLAQHVVMDLTAMPIRANEIEVV